MDSRMIWSREVSTLATSAVSVTTEVSAPPVGRVVCAFAWLPVPLISLARAPRDFVQSSPFVA